MKYQCLFPSAHFSLWSLRELNLWPWHSLHHTVTIWARQDHDWVLICVPLSINGPLSHSPASPSSRATWLKFWTSCWAFSSDSLLWLWACILYSAHFTPYTSNCQLNISTSPWLAVTHVVVFNWCCCVVLQLLGVVMSAVLLAQLRSSNVAVPVVFSVSSHPSKFSFSSHPPKYSELYNEPEKHEKWKAGWGSGCWGSGCG